MSRSYYAKVVRIDAFVLSICYRIFRSLRQVILRWSCYAGPTADAVSHCDHCLLDQGFTAIESSSDL